MEDKQLITLINVQQERINQLEKDQEELLTAYDHLLRFLKSKNEQIRTLRGE
jgi:predicted XRE-type DNA-binding protein